MSTWVSRRLGIELPDTTVSADESLLSSRRLVEVNGVERLMIFGGPFSITWCVVALVTRVNSAILSFLVALGCVHLWGLFLGIGVQGGKFPGVNPLSETLR